MDLCRAKRDAEDCFIPRLTMWFSLNHLPFNLTAFQAWENNHKNTADEWLTRLEKTKDYQHHQKELAKVVAEILLTASKNEAFKEHFLNIAEANNENCGDRSAMCLNEIYTLWKIEAMPTQVPLKDKIDLLKSAAKTFALRRHLEALIAQDEITYKRQETESVEIMLYYENLLRKDLELLTLIQQVQYSQIGARSWINEKQLKKSVEQDYVSDLINMPAFMKLAEKESSYQDLWNATGQHFDDAMEKLENDLSMNSSSQSLNTQDLMTQMHQLTEERKQAQIDIVKEWLDKI